MDQSKEIYNCHTHIFTLNHVPQKFGKTIVPSFISLNLIKKVYKFIKSKNYIILKIKSIINKIDYDFKRIPVLGFLYFLIKIIIKWIIKILLDFFQFDSLLSKEFKTLINRYLNLLRYASYDPGRNPEFGGQDFVLDPLIKYYPDKTKFIVLPMDMDYMKAGKSNMDYLKQIEQLKAVKKNDKYKDKIIPFIFADPRRLRADHNHIDFIIDALEKHDFKGIKLYPALGYYPFEKELIPIYEYAQEKNIPILTHCIKGIVHYRGKKEKQWNRHPILKKKDMYLRLPELKNNDFTVNFTHPMNYECLLNPDILNRYLGKPDSERIDLSSLKICLAHFGGEDEWKKYLNDGWSNFGSVHLFNRKNDILTNKDVEQIWRSTSWLPIIYDLMVKYKNIFADVSYILHDDKLMPLLKEFLSCKSVVREKILFGTDFYVVNTQSTEKDLLNEIRFYLSESNFHQISNINPKKFLNLLNS